MANGAPKTLKGEHGFRELLDALGALLSLHLKLVRLEVEQQLSQYKTPLVLLALMLPCLLTGQVFLCIAGALWVTRWLPLWGSVAVMGAVLVLLPPLLASLFFHRWRQARRAPLPSEPHHG